MLSHCQMWFVHLWVRYERRIVDAWIALDTDPTAASHAYTLQATALPGSPNAWTLTLLVDGQFKDELSGVQLPDTLSVKLRNWNYDSYVPPITDPFNPFKAHSVIGSVRTPLPQVGTSE
jgi:hypothetical protein